MKRLSQADLKECLSYDPLSGDFTWLQRPKQSCQSSPAQKNLDKRFAGKKAGSMNQNGYVDISVMGRKYRAHRLAWLYMTGDWPSSQIDHINRMRSDNRFENLRECSYQQNQANTLLRRLNTSGFKGVSLCKVTQRWRARIRINGKVKCLGRHPSPEDAHKAYTTASKSVHGEFSKP